MLTRLQHKKIEDLKNAICTNNLQEIQKILCTSIYVDLNNCGRYNPLLHACYKGYPIVAGALVKAGADVNVRVERYSSNFGERLSATMHQDLCQALGDMYGHGTVTPLILGVVDRNVELVRKLLQDCGADANATNDTGLTPLHCIPTNKKDERLPASAQVKQEIADLLLKAGAEVNACDGKAETPLHCAAMAKDPVSTRIFLQNGATVDIVNSEGSTPLHTACQAKVDYILYHSAAQIQNIVAVVKLLVDNGTNLSSQKHGLTPLHLAAESGYLNVVKVLVRAGADIHTKAPVTDLTPLDMAVHARKQDVVNYLVNEAAERRRRLQVTKKRTKERQRPKRDSSSVEQAEDNIVSSQQTVTPVEETVEGAVGGIQQLNIKDEDSSDKE